MTMPQPLLEAMHGHLAKDEPRELGNVILLTKCTCSCFCCRATTLTGSCKSLATP